MADEIAPTTTPNQPQSPRQQREATLARAKEAGKAAADRGRGAETPDGAIQAAVNVAAERALAKAEGAPPTAEPADDASEAAEEPAEAASPEEVDVKIKLKQKQRAAQQAFEADRAKFQAEKAEFERLRAESTQSQQQAAERQARLDRLKVEDPAAWVNEMGMTPEIHKRYVQNLLAQGRPEAKALAAESMAEKAIRELNEYKQQQAAERNAREQAFVEQRFVGALKAEDYPVLSGIFDGNPKGLLDHGLWAQQQFTRELGRPGTDAELYFNMECIEAQKVARVTGNQKLLDAVSKARETSDLGPIREILVKATVKPAAEAKNGKKAAPGPSTQARTSQATEEGKPMSQKERRAKAAAKFLEAADRVKKGEEKAPGIK